MESNLDLKRVAECFYWICSPRKFFFHCFRLSIFQHRQLQSNLGHAYPHLYSSSTLFSNLQVCKRWYVDLHTCQVRLPLRWKARDFYYLYLLSRTHCTCSWSEKLLSLNAQYRVLEVIWAIFVPSLGTFQQLVLFTQSYDRTRTRRFSVCRNYPYSMSKRVKHPELVVVFEANF